MGTEKELLRKKEEINAAKDSLNTLKGQKQVYETQLKEDWKCNTLEKGWEKVEQLKSNKEKLQTKIDTALEEIEENYFTENE